MNSHVGDDYCKLKTFTFSKTQNQPENETQNIC